MQTRAFAEDDQRDESEVTVHPKDDDDEDGWDDDDSEDGFIGEE